MRADHAREALRAVLADLENPSIPTQRDEMSSIDRDGDIHMADGSRVDGSSADIVTIPISADDELSDIPAEMRETVAREITAFRDRSNRRDIERLKREEEIAEQERNRMTNGASRLSRLASPPPSAPAGPGGSGAAGSRPLNAPAGPKGFPKDYQKGVMFVNGTGISASSAFDDEDTDASDEELEHRRKEKADADAEKTYLDQERRWLNRERTRAAAVEREKARDEEEDARTTRDKEAMANRLREFDDDTESKRSLEEYYQDRSLWLRNRNAFRGRETALDDSDRAAEHRDLARQRQRAGAMADDFLSRQADELERPAASAAAAPATEEPTRAEPARFKLSLGAAAAQHARDRETREATNKRHVADVEGLLEDEEDVDAGAQRKLVPIKFDPSTAAHAASMTEEERQAAARQLAQEIPTDRAGLWAWDVRWEFVGEEVIDEKLRPFVEKRVVEALGVLEGTVVDVVIGGLREKTGPQGLVEELEGVSLLFPFSYFSRPAPVLRLLFSFDFSTSPLRFVLALFFCWWSAPYEGLEC